MTDDDFRAILQAELAPIRGKLDAILAFVEFIPVLIQDVEHLQRNVRILRDELEDTAP